MKKLLSVLTISVFVFFAHADSLAKVPILPLSKALHTNAVTNLLIGLESENFGLKTSSAYLLGELQSAKAVIPLMKILHSETNEEARIVAALALYKIGDARGLYAIKQAIRFDDSERVSKLCSKFYNAHINNEIAESLQIATK